MLSGTPLPRPRRSDFTPAPLELRRRGPTQEPPPPGRFAALRSKRAGVVASVLFGLAAVAAALTVLAPSGPAASRVDRVTADVVGAVQGAWRRHLQQAAVADDLRNLQVEHEQLRFEVLGLRAVAREHARVSALVGLAERDLVGGVVGRVIRRPSVGRRVLRLDVGAERDVVAGLAVVGPTGVVGQVVASGDGFADVLSVTDPSHGLPVEMGGFYGTARGDGGGLVVEHVVATADVEVGAEVRTSGEGGVFPPGIPVGVVTAIRGTDGPFLRVDVRTEAVPELLAEVLVVQTFAAPVDPAVDAALTADPAAVAAVAVDPAGLPEGATP